MTAPVRRRGIFEGMPRGAYRRTRERYLDAYAVALVVNGLVVAGFEIAVVGLYVDLDAGELALFAACAAAGYVVENLVAARDLRRVGAPVRAWLEGGEATAAAYDAAAVLPVALVRRKRLYVVGAAGSALASVVLAAVLDLPAREAALAFPLCLLLYVSSAVLRYIALELGMR